MPLALGFDADTAYHASLATSVRASEAKRLQEKESAEKERRRSLGLPEDGTVLPFLRSPLFPPLCSLLSVPSSLFCSVLSCIAFFLVPFCRFSSVSSLLSVRYHIYLSPLLRLMCVESKLPRTEHKTRNDKNREKNADPHRRKSVSEKLANLLFNGGRSSKTQMKGEEKVGWGSGAVVRERERGSNGEEGKLEGERRGSSGGSGGEGGEVLRDQNREWERKGDHVPGGML